MCFGKLAATGIWQDTAFPGVHLDLAIGVGRVDEVIGIDVGFNDPLVPPPTTWDNGVCAVRPETMLAWKLHGLTTMGDGWRPKDVADLWLIATRVPLERALVPAAVRAAFDSRGDAIDARVFAHPRWTTKTARVRWARAHGVELAVVIAELRAFWEGL